jgi:class 3 adenylate cyclase/tetratricopeptide (TPR) repeat protein
VAACPTCGAENRAGAKFCSECGTSLLAICAVCGTPAEAGRRFCSECGAPLAAAVPVGPSAAVPGDIGVPTSQRRLVSVLFVDLVGFTTASEARDAEDTRELLTRYFETARRTIERYGGTVEKFIGDAVMAVWGAPVAREDDAERAVRAALELVGLVAGLDPDLRARAGVLTGEAAVTVGAQGQGMVAGDLVNTASRIQSAAEPGTVLVGESTKHASEAAVAYDDVGEHELKGKATPMRLWRALRVVAGVKGAQRVAGLEAPFVGRDREARLVKELFHGAADEHRAQLALVTGIAGVGKSRLSWEFEKYVDGLVDDVFWHRGRCLSYGDGVAYWALAEMVRMRCGIFEEDDPEVARSKLRLSLQEYLLDADERAWVEPRLAHLLGLEEGAPGDQENLFSAWRILFERLAQQSPTILVFEDLQWADTGLLDFIEYLLDWSRAQPLFVLAVARPEFAERRPGWGTGKRSFSSLYLEPLSDASMGELLDGLVPGLPDDLRERVKERAEGVPLYAVETVRMLLDRGLLVREGHVYRATGDVESLEVPETLHALVAARLDALPFEERRLVECGAVLGKTFTKGGLAAVSGVAEGKLDTLLSGLLGKEILSVQADPRSPELGQYAFLQDIVKRVAYETISRRERKAKHLAAARYLAEVAGSDDDDVVEVVAAHLLDAYQAAPEDDDAAELRTQAFEMLVRAAERAASLGASTEAWRAYERAAGMTDDIATAAGLVERAGTMAYVAGAADEAATLFDRAIGSYESIGATHPAARVRARAAEVAWDRGRIEQGLDSMDRAFEVLAEEEPDGDLAALAAQIGRFRFFNGQLDSSFERLERALELAETLQVPEVLSSALNTKGLVLVSRGRPTEGHGLIRNALEVALENDKPSAALRAYYNLADVSVMVDRTSDATALAAEGLALARRVGNRYWEWSFLGMGYASYLLGDWDDVAAREAELPDDDWTRVRIAFSTLLTSIVPVRIHRGQLDEAQRLTRLFGELESSGDIQELGQVRAAEAALLLAQGRPADALASARVALDTRQTLGLALEAVREAFVVALDAALGLADLEAADELLGIVAELPPGRVTPFLDGQSARFAARVAGIRGDVDGADAASTRAVGVFRQLGYPFCLGAALLEHAERLVGRGEPDRAEPLVLEALATFERLGAQPWVDRARALAPVGSPATA